ncbi:hypothetical protein CROQUDRAFT_668073 [Cronartium quercuum f. sp. fusiforme G11]|uniref:Uncharacterized protein n=1 Tax=Cronartium quercuum f. sp. fusiforme G11 TaxID=708437 RepID=A0A9P6NTA5_9BASI|nr:hypothetical protein CROQUDRAFT_668073 [Cronartium quercuum f. sp. fusiforme G11]
MRRLPFDVLTRIAGELGYHGSRLIDDPDSIIYWALSGYQLAAYRLDRISPLEAFSQSHLKSLLSVSRDFRQAANYRLRTPLVIQKAGDIRRIVNEQGLTRGLGQPASSIEVVIKQDLWAEVFALIQLHADCLSSLTLDVGSEAQYLNPVVLCETLIRLPHINKFTYRAGLTGVWINQKPLLTLLSAWPDLRHLTIFQLYGSSAIETNNALKPISTVKCQLRSIHLRRLCHVSEDNLREILVNSFESLVELTIVFDRTPHHPQSQGSHRGLKLSALTSVLKDCRAIQILRIGDLIPRIHEYELAGRNVPYDIPDKPLGFVVDELVRSLADLRVLEMSGRIFSMDLFENLCTAGVSLERLTILRHPGFPLKKFLNHLTTNPALQKLSILRMGNELKLEEADRVSLESVCRQRKVCLEWLSVSEEEIEEESDVHMVEWSEDEEYGLSDDAEFGSSIDSEDNSLSNEDHQMVYEEVSNQ